MCGRSMFSISGGEFFVAVGAGLLLVGNRDLPHLCRSVGRVVGASLRIMRQGRAHLEEFAQHSQLNQVCVYVCVCVCVCVYVCVLVCML